MTSVIILKALNFLYFDFIFSKNSMFSVILTKDIKEYPL